MPNLILEKEWTQWYPKKIFLKNEKNNQKFLYYSDKFTKKDFFIDTKNQKNDQFKNNNEFKIDLTKTEGYKIGFQKGFLQGKEENVLLEHQLNKLCLDFEQSLSAFENAIYSRLLTIVLKISSYVIGKKIDSDEKMLIKYIKKIINKDGIFLKKPQLIIHPHNRLLVEKTFKDFFSTHQWILVYDDSINLNSCKVRSENGYIDATIDARWQELCRLIYSEEY